MLPHNSIMGGHPHATFKVFIDGKPYEFEQSKVTALDILKKVNKTPSNCYSVYKGLESCDFVIIRPDQEVDLREIGSEIFKIEDPVVFNYFVNNEPETTDLGKMTPLQILERVDIDPAIQYLVQLHQGQAEEIYAWRQKEAINMVCTGMKFITRPWTEMVDIEQLGKTCQPVPVAKKYRVKIQNQYHVVDSPYLSEEQFILLGGKPDVKKWDVLMFLSNQAEPVKIAKGETVDLLTPCIIYFVLQPKEQTEGKEVRRQFSVLPHDQEFLNMQGLLWETLHTPLGHCVIIHDFPVPVGYNIEKVQVGLIIPPTYPATQIDMAYFHPALQVTPLKHIGALSTCTIDGRTFQRWSRHRAADEWVPGVDNISTHLHLVKNWLLKELNS